MKIRYIILVVMVVVICKIFVLGMAVKEGVDSCLELNKSLVALEEMAVERKTYNGND